MTKRELPALSIVEVQNLLRRREVSPAEVLESLEERINAVDDKIGAYLAHDFAAALTEAEKTNVNLPLGGIPIALKDLINVEGQQCTLRLENSWQLSRTLYSNRDRKVARTWRDSVRTNEHGRVRDGILHGKFERADDAQSMGLVPSAWGSSGGPAAAVAADIAFGALGTDTGGSIRQPAALSGVVGFKPSYGRVSRFGLVAFASSLDQIGPLTKTVRDSALLMNAIAGHDLRDSTSLKAPVPDYTKNLGRDLKGIRIGLPKEYMIEGLDPAVKTAVMASVKQLEELGAQIFDVSLPHTDYAVSVYYILATAEASANLARFDGVRYGYRADNIVNLFDHYARTREEGFGAEVKRRIILGTYVLSTGYYDAYYLHAQKVRELIRQDFVRVFEKVDALASPTSPTPAFKFGEKTTDPLQMYLADIFTNAANLAGICGISVPCGFAESESGRKLPIGLQLLGKALDEDAHFQIAHAFERRTEWHKVHAQTQLLDASMKWLRKATM